MAPALPAAASEISVLPCASANSSVFCMRVQWRGEHQVWAITWASGRLMLVDLPVRDTSRTGHEWDCGMCAVCCTRTLWRLRMMIHLHVTGPPQLYMKRA